MTQNFHLTVDGFFKQAKGLRSHFDSNFSNPRSSSSERFVWDYWHIPKQYTAIRTPAYHYFPKGLYEQFHRQLVQWGRETLGCYEVSPPWLSYYVDGCYQEMHSDVPHGPWAFVFSLTNWSARKFTGGETWILKPEVLDYWPTFSDQVDREYNSFVQEIPSRFNRLTVFDPRFPHGVREVRGVRNPRDARIVIHGWFTEPQPYIVGGLTRKKATMGVNNLLEQVSEATANTALIGTMILKLNVNPAGAVTSARATTNTLISLDRGLQMAKVQKAILGCAHNTQFLRAPKPTVMTLPLIFK